MAGRAISPRRAADESNTIVVNDFLDKYFYTEENGFTDVERVNDRARQVRGVDVEFFYNGNPYRADEKAATSWINRNLKTFSLELAFIDRSGEIFDGWFLNEELSTDSYVFVWIDDAEVVPFSEDRPDIDVLKGVDGIKKADIALIDKSAVLGYLFSLGWSKDALRRKCEGILENPMGHEMGNVWRNGCKFSYSQQLVEKPVNVIIPKDKIIGMSDFHLHYEK